MLGYTFLISLFLRRKKGKQIIATPREKVTQAPCSGVGSIMLPCSQLPDEESPTENKSWNERRLAALAKQKIKH